MPDGIFANLGQWHSRYLHEPEYEIFKWLADIPGLVLDIGANRGCSALSVLRHTSQMKVLSIEPNRRHRWDLLSVLLLHPTRFRFRLIAAGNTADQTLLYIPDNQNLNQSGYGSLVFSEFEKSHVREYFLKLGIDVGDKSNFHKAIVTVIPLDELHLSPDLIKLDVEGFECQALQGLKDTLERLLPALIIEMNHSERWLPFLQSLGYDLYRYEPQSSSLIKASRTDGVLNIICLHRHSRSLITETLIERAGGSN